jgi:PhnB protein
MSHAWLKTYLALNNRCVINRPMNTPAQTPVVSFMLAVENTPVALAWYEKALGAHLLWSLGSVAALEINGAPFLLHEPVPGRFQTPLHLRSTSVRIEVFLDNPEPFITRAVEAGAIGEPVKDFETPWGIHRQGGFTDPFGHIWLVGDKTPLKPFPPRV